MTGSILFVITIPKTLHLCNIPIVPSVKQMCTNRLQHYKDIEVDVLIQPTLKKRNVI
jgi:hypothetical protein